MQVGVVVLAAARQVERFAPPVLALEYQGVRGACVQSFSVQRLINDRAEQIHTPYPNHRSQSVNELYQNLFCSSMMKGR